MKGQQPARVLIVDASPGASAVARNLLLAAGHDAVVAHGMADAIRIAAEVPHPDLVVLDTELAAPYMLRELARVTRPDLEVVLAIANRGLMERMFVTEIEDVCIVGTIQKPYVGETLLEAVSAALSPGSDDPTVDGLDAIDVIETIEDESSVASLEELRAALAAGNETIEDDPAVSAEAERLARRIGSQIPQLVEDSIQRRLLTRACALALEDSADDTPAAGTVALEGRVGPIAVEQIFHLAENIPGLVSVRFTQDARWIELFFLNRRLVFAQSDNVEDKFGVQALAAEAIRWDAARFIILRDVTLPALATLDEGLPVPFVLLEGLRQLDERHRNPDDLDK